LCLSLRRIKIREACLLRDAREKSSAKQEVPCSSGDYAASVQFAGNEHHVPEMRFVVHQARIAFKAGGYGDPRHCGARLGGRIQRAWHDMILGRCPAFGATGTADVAARMFHNRATRVIRLMHKIEVYAPEGPANCAYVIQRGIV